MARASGGAKTKSQGKAAKKPAAAKPAKAAASRTAKPAAKPAPGPEMRLSIAAALLRKNARRIGA